MVESLQNGSSAFFAYIPQLLGAIVILIVGYIVAKILQAVVGRLLGTIGFDRWMEHGRWYNRAAPAETPPPKAGPTSPGAKTGPRPAHCGAKSKVIRRF